MPRGERSERGATGEVRTQGEPITISGDFLGVILSASAATLDRLCPAEWFPAPSDAAAGRHHGWPAGRGDFLGA